MRIRKRMMRLASEKTFKDEFYTEEGKLDLEAILNYIITDGESSDEWAEHESGRAEPDVGIMSDYSYETANTVITCNLSLLVKDVNNINEEEIDELQKFLDLKAQDEQFVWEILRYVAEYSPDGIGDNYSKVTIDDEEIIFVFNYEYNTSDDYV